jgi:CubicO group peptidase (beta-lactamase class C family)
MRSLRNRFLSFIILCYFFSGNLSVLAQQAEVYSSEILQKIKLVEQNLGESIKTSHTPIILWERMKEFNIPGLSIAVIKDFNVEWAKSYGYADLEKNIPVTTQTLFQAASISKSLNGLGILKLAEQKQLDLDKDINTYLTTWKFPYDPKVKTIITTKNLLSHTAGLSVHGFRGYASGEPVPDIVKILNGENPANSAPIRSIFDAGTKVQYSGGGTTISQLMVMDITKSSYDEYMYKNVLEPLKMYNSFCNISPPANRVSLLASGYRRDGQQVKGKFHLYPEQAAASLWTNPTELCRFIIELQLGFAGKSKYISRETANTMLTAVMNEAAPGVFIKKAGSDTYFSHGGANEGFRSQYYGSLEGGNGVVVMVNSDNGVIIEELINSVATVYEWKDFYKPIIKLVVQVADEVLDNYVGEYQLTPDFIIKIFRDGPALKIEAANQPIFDLFAEAENKFFLKVVDAQIEFIKGETNKIAKLVLYQNGQTMNANKIK